MVGLLGCWVWFAGCGVNVVACGWSVSVVRVFFVGAVCLPSARSESWMFF